MGIAGIVVGYVPQDSRLNTDENPCANRQIGSRVNDPSSCKAYWVCRENGPEPARCGGPGVFHPERQTCVSDADYSCDDTVATTTEAPNVCSCREDGHRVKNDDVCDAYWLCTAYGPVLSSCGDGYIFHTALEVCVSSKDFRCGVDGTVEVIPPSPCLGIADGQFINNPKNCQAYFYCFGNMHYEDECKNGLSFNPENQWCDWQYYCKDKPRVKS